jgi:hypothetical protein
MGQVINEFTQKVGTQRSRTRGVVVVAFRPWSTNLPPYAANNLVGRNIR